MRYPPGHKEKTRARIIEAAFLIFRRSGYHATGIDEVMEAAGLTAGAFYAHFRSKEDLLAEVLTSASESGGPLAAGIEGPVGADWVDRFLARYLSPIHRVKIDEGCPLVALISEVARAQSPAREGAELLVRELSTRIVAKAAAGGLVIADEAAFAAVGLCVGGLGLARAVHDEELALRILDSSREAARAILMPGRN